MTLQQITADDISGWDSLDDIASSFEKRGLRRRPKRGEENEIVLQLADDEFIKLVKAGANESTSDYKPENLIQSTNLVATNDYTEFTFLTYARNPQQHGRIKHQRLSFTKEQMTSESGEKHTILEKLNGLEYDSLEGLRDLYDTKRVVDDFYEKFEELRTNLVDHASLAKRRTA
ncbi:hypothetical protein [Haloarcula marismortui]|jgi:hypothetical protein|uniref:Uncharacterized protein n=1 Tax=Haloarcula marismortui ATCC 33800 TaxID=662476 RepID=A0A8T8KJV5_9EURY|nr:hypothetical protein [Haloarcula sinaiiensis]QUJ74759.1 hypothetical protein KDQ40_21790 [Haloarcula sinaiiensis ATCC 33800]